MLQDQEDQSRGAAGTEGGEGRSRGRRRRMKMMKTADFLSLSLSFCSTVLSVGRPSGLRPPVIGVSSLIWAGLLWRACPVG